MPRYIDIEQEIEQMQTTLNERAGTSEFADYVFNLFIEKLKNAPTADVVPRSEVESLKEDKALLIALKEQLVEDHKHEVEELTEARDKYKKYYFRHEYDKWGAEIKQEVAKEILTAFSQFRALSPKFCEVYYELEKKYIGEKK